MGAAKGFWSVLDGRSDCSQGKRCAQTAFTVELLFPFLSEALAHIKWLIELRRCSTPTAQNQPGVGSKNSKENSIPSWFRPSLQPCVLQAGFIDHCANRDQNKATKHRDCTMKMDLRLPRLTWCTRTQAAASGYCRLLCDDGLENMYDNRNCAVSSHHMLSSPYASRVQGYVQRPKVRAPKCRHVHVSTYYVTYRAK